MVINLLILAFEFTSRYHCAIHPLSKHNQLHVIQEDKLGKPLPSTFGIVGLKKVRFLDGHRLKSACTLCPLGPNYQSFLHGEFSELPLPPFISSLFLPCRHIQYVISSLYSQLDVVGDDAYDGQAIEGAILESMQEDNVLRSGWFDLPFEMPLVGTFAVYLSDQWDPQLLKVFLSFYSLDIQK